MTTEEPADASAWRRVYGDALPQAAPPCPDEDALAGLATGDIGGEDRQGLADHLVGCPRCAETYRLLRELDAAASASRRNQRLGVSARWAAALVLSTAAALLYLERATAPEPPALRGGDARLEAPGVAPATGSRLAEAPARFDWQPEADAVSYQVVVYDEAAVPLWQSARLSEPSLSLSPELRSRLRAGTYYWRVRIDSNRGPSATPLYRFEIAP